MIEKNKIYENSYGNKLFINLGDDIDLNNYDEINILVQKPRMFELESEETYEEKWIAKKSEEKDNVVEYTFNIGDLDQNGRYYIQVELISEESENESRLYSDTILLEVYKRFK